MASLPTDPKQPKSLTEPPRAQTSTFAPARPLHCAGPAAPDRRRLTDRPRTCGVLSLPFLKVSFRTLRHLPSWASSWAGTGRGSVIVVLREKMMETGRRRADGGGTIRLAERRSDGEWMISSFKPPPPFAKARPYADRSWVISEVPDENAALLCSN